MTLTYRVQSTTSPRQRTPDIFASSDALRRAFVETVDKLRNLWTWQEGWTGYNVAAPKPEAIRSAMMWATQMYEDALATSGKWHTPHVAANADGDVMFEWWNEETQKGLAVYVSERNATYILDWGTNMETEMEDGEADTRQTRRRLWAELMN